MAFPAELIHFNQWAVCSVAHGDMHKVPYDYVRERCVKVNDTSTFLTYSEAYYRPQEQYPHVGFVLTPDDPYTIIDLDPPVTPEQAARHTKIMAAFPTYTELSQSGKGVHIICKGSVPCGVRRDKVEVYSASRFMIMTGNTIKDLPIVDCQPMLDLLYGEMAADNATLLDIGDGEESRVSDGHLVHRALRAANGAKFDSLLRGNMEGYPSQSEADFALLSLLCFWTKDNLQVKSIFRCSPLGKRDKAARNDVYLNRSIRRIRSNELPIVDLEQLPALRPSPVPVCEVSSPIPGVDSASHSEAFTREAARYTEDIVSECVHTDAPPSSIPRINPTIPRSCIYPPGVLGDIAHYITQSNIRPVAEVGLVAALAFLSGIVGRQYNISGTGLNQYLILMAPTGTGKEGAASGIDRLFNALQTSTPAIDAFQGPGSFASGQALVKRMADKPCFVSVLGEFGLTLKRLSSKYIAPADITLKQALLDLYQKSGWSSTLKSSVYSDKEKNSAIVRAPALTILGESTPESLLEELSPQLIADGLLPRFITIEYTGDRPRRNRDPFNAPDAALLAKLENIVMTVFAMQSNDANCKVDTSDEALDALDAFDDQCDDHIRKMTEVHKHLWNRAHLKALKLAGLAAVADNPQAPCVTLAHATWAIALVEQDIKTISKRFEENTVGDGEVRFESLLRKTIEQYATLPVDRRVKSYAVPKTIAEDQTVVPFHYLRRRFRLLSAFVQHRQGVKAAIKLCLDDCLEAGIIQELPLDQVLSKFGARSRIFVQGPAWG